MSEDKPTIYNAPTIYKTGAQGGGGGGGGGNWNYENIAGKDYIVCKIGQKTWMAENLDSIFNGISINPNGAPNSPASFYKDLIYKTAYGSLYNWFAANYLEQNKSTLIPGWHVPTISEVNDLISNCGGVSNAGKALKFTDYWIYDHNGTNEVNFRGLPAGYRDGAGNFYEQTERAYFLTTEDVSSLYTTVFRLFDDSNSVQINDNYKAFAYSIRLVKD